MAGPRVSLRRAWRVRGGEGHLDAALVQALHPHGVAVSNSGGPALDLAGGSGAKMRLLGGWFVGLSTLPKAGSIARRRLDGGHTEIALALEESMGFGVLDRKLARRYEEAFEHIALSIEAALTATADECETI